MYSPMRAAGAIQGTLKRRSLCARTWLPRPSTKRPPEWRARSQAWFATIIGLRGKAMATEVASCTRSVAKAAKASGAKGSWRSSFAVTASNPSSSAARAEGPHARQSSTGRTMETRIVDPLRYRAIG